MIPWKPPGRGGPRWFQRADSSLRSAWQAPETPGSLRGLSCWAQRRICAHF